MNRLAETCYPDGQAPRRSGRSGPNWRRELGHDEEAQRLRDQAAAAPVRDALGRVPAGAGAGGAGPAGGRGGRTAGRRRREPDNFAVQFLMGNCCLDGYIDGLGEDSDAVGCYSACIAMRPDFHAAYANRGLMRPAPRPVRRRPRPTSRGPSAAPDRADLPPDRAQAREGLHHNQEELDDLNQAEELGSKAVLLYYLRAARRISGWVMTFRPGAT